MTLSFFVVLFALLGSIQLSTELIGIGIVSGALALGAVYSQGILGPFRGKVGGVVGSKWKAIDYMRGYVVPNYPGTPSQLIQNDRMASVVALGRQILGAVLRPFWDFKYSNQSGWSAFIQANIMLLADMTYLVTTDNVFAKGGITITPVADVTYETGVGTIGVDVSSSSVGNQESDDIQFLVIINKTDNTVVFAGENGTRASIGSPVINDDLSAADLLAFVFYVRDEDYPEFDVSDSVGVQVSAT